MNSPVATFRMTPLYDLLLRGDDETPVGLYHLQLATAEQLCRLHYRMGCLTAVKARLKTLVDNGYIQADNVPSKHARKPYYYTLDKRGMAYLDALGLDARSHFRADREPERDWLFLWHALELNDVIIAAAGLHDVDARYTLASFIHDRVLKRTMTGRVVPDAFLDFHATLDDGTKRRRPVLLEHDRGTEHQQQLRTKVRGYLTMLHTRSYQQLFATKGSITIIFTTFKDGVRLQQLREWAEAEFNQSGETAEYRSRFLFASLTKPVDPGQIWFEPCWYYATGNESVSLLRMP